jgi:hypothetical protein
MYAPNFNKPLMFLNEVIMLGKKGLTKYKIKVSISSLKRVANTNAHKPKLKNDKVTPAM